ncbi:MAG TPA: hypothetical protein VMW75_06540 [Thermoanaerobaculia bacterium]|nr:hypothetical protein [Thermoanaerobaculia bacterium]
MNPRRSLFAALGPALLLAGASIFPASGAGMAYPSIAHLDGYLSAPIANGDCVMLRQHDGRTYSLRGNLEGLRSGDHVRLEGRFAPDPGCNAPGFSVLTVQELWADDNHRDASFDYRSGEPFARYAERIGRFSDDPGGPGQEGGAAGGGHDRDAEQEHRDSRENGGNGELGRGRGAENERHDGGEGEAAGDRAGAEHGPHDADRADRADGGHADPERTDRSGRYVYRGPHRPVTLVGKLHQVEGACPTLATTHAVFALDGDLGAYQAGDDVSVSGTLYEGDPNAPCGGPTVVIRGIHGHGRR